MRTSNLRRYNLPLVLSITLAGLFTVIASCGGGGGGGSTGPPFIYAEIFSLPTGSSLPGYESTSVYVVDDNTGYPITNAIVTINNVTLPYIPAYDRYEGNVIVVNGGSVVLNVTVGGKTYTVSGTQFSSYPTIVQPALGATWAASLPHTIKWSGNDPSVFQGLGILDADDPGGQLLWPADGYLRELYSDATSYVIPENNLTPGSRLAVVCIWKDVYMTDATPGSVLSIGGFNYAPFTVTNASLVSISVTPANPSIPKGLTQQLTATGYFSDNSTEDLTNLVTWSSSNPGTVNISNLYPGVSAYGNAVGSTNITATYGNISGFTTLTVTPAVLVSIAVYPQTLDPTIAIGMTLQYTAGGTLSDGMGADVTATAAWSTSDPGIALISNATGSQGMATSLAAGSVTITASVGAISGSATLNVTNWTLRNSGMSVDLNAVVWSGSQFLVVGSNGTVLTSPDGGLWTKQTTSTSETLHDVTWSGTTFVAVGENGTILTSGDGIAWNPQTSGTNLYLSGVTWSGTQFVVVGIDGAVYTSSDGITWEPRSSGISDGLDDVVWSGTQYVAVGSSDIITSSDGVTWQSRIHTFQPYKLFCSIAWSGDLYVAVKCERTSLSTFEYPVNTSPDGITWTERFIGSSRNLSDVIWTGTQFVAVSGCIIDDHSAMTSPDGISWTNWGLGIPPDGGALRALVWSGTQYVVVGTKGTILTGPPF